MSAIVGSRRRDREWPLWLRGVRRIVRGALRLAFRFRVRGADHVPLRGPVLLVANHASHLDPPLIGCASPRWTAYLARSTLFAPRGFGALIRILGAVPIERDSTGLGGIRTTLAVLDADGTIVVFPEGTRTTDGRAGELRGGFVTIARRSAAPIVPVWVEGSFAAFPRGARFPRPRPISVSFGHAFRVPDDADERAVIEIVEKQWAALAERRPIPAPGGQYPSGA